MAEPRRSFQLANSGSAEAQQFKVIRPPEPASAAASGGKRVLPASICAPADSALRPRPPEEGPLKRRRLFVSRTRRRGSSGVALRPDDGRLLALVNLALPPQADSSRLAPPYRKGSRMSDDKTALLEMTAGIIANYVVNNRVAPEDLPGVISAVHGALAHVGRPEPDDQGAAPGRLTPAQIRQLITPLGIMSLIDGRRFKSLRRHVTANGYTAESYREHFGLPRDFPMVSPDYAATRSAMARAAGLGRKKTDARPSGKGRAKQPVETRQGDRSPPTS